MSYIIFDGYNVIRQIEKYKNAERESLADGREALLFDVEEYCNKFDYNGVVVFDAGSGDSKFANWDMFGSIDVVYSGRDQIADDLIAELVKDYQEENGDVFVVTFDSVLRCSVITNGGCTVTPADFANFMKVSKPLG